MLSAKRLIPLLMILSLICMGFSPATSSAKTIVSKDQQVTNQDIEELANDLEYLFTEILIKDETTGAYYVDLQAVEQSDFSKEEKDELRNYARELVKKGELSPYSTFDRCMKDLLGIGNAAWKEIKSYIDAKQYIAAASAILFATGVAVNPIVIGIFVATCGPSSAG